MRPRPRLTPEQNQLLTSLDRIAIPIVEARKMARKDLALQGALKALDNELFLKLPPPVATEEMTREYDRLERQWYARLDEWILENLRDGRLVAFGVPLPITMTSTPHPVPTGLWHKLQLDVGNGTAESPDWSYTRLRIVDVRPMSDNGRAKVERVFWVFGQIQMEAIFRQARRSNSRTARTRAGTSSNPDRSTPARGTPDNPVHVFIAGADETVALKTESLRRNTRYGKLDPVAPATVVAKTDALRRNTQHGKAKPASLTPEQTPSGGAAVFNEVAPALETEEAIEVEVKRSGPKTLMPQIKAHLIERSRKAECKQPWTVESVHLHTWAKNKFAVEIRTKQTKLPAIKRLREVLADTYYKSNPAFDRLQRFKQESTQAKTQAKSQAKR